MKIENKIVFSILKVEIYFQKTNLPITIYIIVSMGNGYTHIGVDFGGAARARAFQ